MFYESLYREKPTAEIAIKWCVEHGVFLPDEQERVYKDYARIVSKEKSKALFAASGAGAGAGSHA